MNEPTENRPRYDDEFYLGLDESAAASAAVLLEIVGRYVQPKSVVDVGCGTGQWLLEARRRFGAEILGLDGEWNTQLELFDGAQRTVDFERGLSIGRSFDLAICLEVAEHLTAASASHLIGELCEAADVVLFSAAVEEQPGEHHINCRWQSEWIADFESRGFSCFDVLRPQVWNNPKVAWWYRQNVFLAVRTGSGTFSMLNERELPACLPVDIVHPDNYVTMMRAMAEENRMAWDELYRAQQAIEHPTVELLGTTVRNFGKRVAGRGRSKLQNRRKNRSAR